MRKRPTLFILILLIIVNIPQNSGLHDVSTAEINTYPPREGDIEGFSVDICDWRWNRTGAVTLSFDDGLNSQAMIAAPLLSLFEFPSTFFVTTDNCNIPYGANWSDWQNISDMGHEIGSHSISHPDLRTVNASQLWDEVVLSKIILEENISGLDCETFSYPMGRYDADVLQLVSENYLAARTDSHNITGDPKPEDRHPENLYSVVPCNFGSVESLSHMSDLVNETISSGGWLVEMIHAIGTGGYDPVPFDRFQDHLEYLDRMWKDLWVDTFVNVSKYIREREHSTVHYTVEDDEYLNISVTHSLGDDHDIPLTLGIDLPSDWIDVDIIKDGSFEHVSQYHRIEDGYQKRSLLVEADVGSTLIIRKNVTYPEILTGPILWLESEASENGFIFVADYLSRIGRNSDFGIRIHFDLNGDGDSLDEVNGMVEGNHSMICDITGSIPVGTLLGYDIPVEFPPGIHNPRFYFETYDNMGLYAREPSSGFFKGPFINNPPQAPRNITILDDHTTEPSFSWSESIDPDGDNVTYHLSMYWNGSLVTKKSTTDTSISFMYMAFDMEFQLEMNATDELGASSENVSFNFTLWNDPPHDPKNLSVSNLHSFAPIFSFDPPYDPDGDPITISKNPGYGLSVMYDPVYRTMDNGSFTMEIDQETRHDPMEHWFNINHTMEIRFWDDVGSDSRAESVTFRPYNHAPPMIEWFNITYTNGTITVINLDESIDPDGDPVTYEIGIAYRYVDEEFKNITSLSFSTNSTSLHLHEILIEGMDYLLNVTAVDPFGGRSSMFSQEFEVKPPPESVVDLSIIDRGSIQGGVLLMWEYPYDLFYEVSGFKVYVYDQDPEKNILVQPIRALDMEHAWGAGIDNLEEGKDYWFTVIAYDEYGVESHKKVFIKGTPIDILPPSKPSNLRATLWEDPYGCSLNWHQITIDDLAGFHIYRIEGAPPPDLSTIQPIHSIINGPDSITTWIDTTITENRRYNYTVVSIDQKGNMDTEDLIWREFSTYPEVVTDDDDHELDMVDDPDPFGPYIFLSILVLANILILTIAILIIKKRMERGDFDEE